jgi:DNA polymerase III alpha subunit
MIRFCRKDEKQKQTSQIGLFDQSDEFEDKLELKDMEEFSFEEKLAGEKEMIGFYISGHPLDGLKRYCVRRSNNVKKLRMSMEDLLEEDKKANPDKYAPKKE